MSELSLAFIGLGNMGSPMARRLVDAGFDVTVADLDATRVADLVADGATGACDAAGAAADADVVLTSLPAPADVRAVGELIVPVMRRGATWIDLSTNDLDCAGYIDELCHARGVEVLDAPVTGGVEGAMTGTLNVLVGGDSGVFDRCVPVLDVLGERHDLLGPRGSGYVAKIAQVMLCYLNSVCLTEALMLGVKGGVAADRMLDIIRHSTGSSYVADRYGPEILSGGYDTTFDLGLAAKDLRLARNLAAHLGAELPFTADVGRFYDDAELAFGFGAPHLIAMQQIERQNALVFHRQDTGGSS